jgi:K+-transporting ATPase KdpF subunit
METRRSFTSGARGHAEVDLELAASAALATLLLGYLLAALLAPDRFG